MVSPPNHNQASIPINAVGRWGLLVLTGSSTGMQFPLQVGSHSLGSGPLTKIRIPAPGIAPLHCEFLVGGSSVQVRPCVNGIRLNGADLHQVCTLSGGDVIELGALQLQLIDLSSSGLVPAGGAPQLLSAIPSWLQLTLALGVAAVLLTLLTLVTGNLKLGPITLLVSAAVVPIGVLGFVYSRFGPTVVSMRSMVITLGLGATLGVITTILLGVLVPIGNHPSIAPLYEEPAKLLATIWCWNRVAYRSPLAGLILGLAAGTGFAVAETAGYIMEQFSEEGVAAALGTLIVRSGLSPFAHGVWTAAVASAWFQMGWRFQSQWERVFLRALLMAMALHALWNLGLCFGVLASATASFLLFRALLRTRGTWSARWKLLPQ
jgi:RsiW-degrading membrane proteinase PrsW (M82 family)